MNVSPQQTSNRIQNDLVKMENDNNSDVVLDVSKKNLKKIIKVENSKDVKVLILDDNDLQKIDNIDTYLGIEKLSLKRNNLLRMYGVSRLHNLRELNLSYNSIIGIEALKECIHLTHLNLEGNQIKTIEHLNTNSQLVYLNLGENSIGVINDISFLKHLKELYLHKNKICHLRQVDRFLPGSVETLTLDKNQIVDLNEIHTLTNLNNLTSITFNDNPCVQMTGGNSIGFDYRPFLLNWCMSVKVIDGFVVNPIESLKAEWLFSQGKGRSFRVGDQKSLSQYLSQVCPLNVEVLEDENERKLRLILSKAQQHQRQLHEQLTSGNASPSTPSSGSAQNSPSSIRKKNTKIQSPRGRVMAVRPSSENAMVASYSYGTTPGNDLNNTMSQLDMTKSLSENFTNDLMTRSLDSSLIDSSVLSNTLTEVNETPTKPVAVDNGNFYNEQPVVTSQFPMVTASKMMPIPESLMSPDCPPPFIITNQSQSQKTKPITTTGKSQLSKVSLLQRPSSSPASIRNQKTTTTKKTSDKSPSSPKRKLATESEKVEKNQKTVKQAVEKESHDVEDGKSKKTLQNGEKDKEKIVPQPQQQQKQIKLIENREIENSAIVIQKLWRGYCIRKKFNNKISEVLHQKRTQDYITKLTKDMEKTKQALENERKIQQLQMQAINALWKKVSHMQISENPLKDYSNNNLNSNELIQDLVKTCSILTNQVQQLQNSMQEVLSCMTLFSQLPHVQQQQLQMQDMKVQGSTSTQTEIVAVHTPQLEHLSEFPFIQKIPRPCSLPINDCALEK